VRIFPSRDVRVEGVAKRLKEQSGYPAADVANVYGDG